ncbi:GerAB/ArcD/ProY family transporter [Bacillus thuringiensis]
MLKDFSFFISQVLFQNVHPGFISFTFILLIGYACFVGIESIARSSQILLVMSIVMIVPLMLFGFLSPSFEFGNLTPVFQVSWKQVLASIFPRSITSPFGELLVFTMLFPYANNYQSLKKHAWIVVLLTGILLVIAGEITLGILSPEIVTIYAFPFIKALETINYLPFIQHLEVLAVLVNLIGGFIKITIFMYAWLNGFTQILAVKKQLGILPLLAV